ncbi:Phage tail sheath protein FI [Lysobacter dokdonensis DS-58]|uniref:Phage tail sheath protein FI n=1 Tax=Lysobacter dokdonensis DS-58 TaxID=1300345 RepID=A0A0A2WM66_9GAMM|nr:phage tail sheath C-terminal domain-containing protein [Lysobacter dokdonensis]KGQ19380.1 Phage tail sheath protein FI [Lysobacter dokdonensis DS-58]
MAALLSRSRAPGVYVEWLDANPQALDLARTDVAGFIGIAERGPLHEACKVESMRQFVTTFGAHIAQGYLAYAVEGFFANGGRTCWVVRVADPAKAKRARIALRLPDGKAIALEATSDGCWGNSVRIAPIWERDAVIGLSATAEGRPPQVLAFDAMPTLAQETLVRRIEPSADEPLEVLGAGIDLAGGDDGIVSLRPAHFSGDASNDPDNKRVWGMDALSRIDGISFVAAPDLVGAPVPGFKPEIVRDAQIALLARCLEQRDRIALLDLPRTNQTQAMRYVAPGSPTQTALPRTSYAAVYHPWVMVDDALRIDGNVRVIPPSGHVAGMLARTDRRRGVHKAPANEVLEGVWDLQEAIDDDAHARLNDAHINAIRAIPGRGIRVLGARTLDDDPSWRYIGVRRLFAMIGEALDEQMQWLAFEPDSPRLWRDIDRAVRGFLERLYRAGMLDGATPEEAYFVRCDATTNPREQTDAGRVMCELGLRPPRPAEFVIVRIGVTRDNGVRIEAQGAQDV